MQEAAQQAAAVVDSAPVAAESFDANPRSMEAAVANLARFTSDTPAGASANHCRQLLIRHSRETHSVSICYPGSWSGGIALLNIAYSPRRWSYQRAVGRHRQRDRAWGRGCARRRTRGGAGAAIHIRCSRCTRMLYVQHGVAVCWCGPAVITNSAERHKVASCFCSAMLNGNLSVLWYRRFWIQGGGSDCLRQPQASGLQQWQRRRQVRWTTALSLDREIAHHHPGLSAAGQPMPGCADGAPVACICSAVGADG